MDNKIGESEEFLIRVHYDIICNNLNTADLIPVLKDENILKKEDIDTLEFLNGDKKTEYIIFNILIKNGTEATLGGFKKALEKTGNSRVLEIFNSCPSGVNDDRDSFTNLEAEETNISSKEVETVASETQQHHVKNNLQEDEEEGESSSGEEDVLRAAGGFKIRNPFKKSQKKEKKKEAIETVEYVVPNEKKDCSKESSVGDMDKQQVNTATPKKQKVIVTEFSDAFMEYECKDTSSLHGRGICVIFSLFTTDLQGYLKDVQKVKEFFGDKLGYEVWGGERHNNRFQNLTQDELFSRIFEVRNHIENQKHFDRLVVVILTHGKPDGLLTCADSMGDLPEQHIVQYINRHDNTIEQRYRETKTKVEEIVDCFKHDCIKSLKGMPKLFLIQACRGSDTVKAANVSNAQNFDETDNKVEYDFSKLRFKESTPIDGDIMICQSTTEKHSSLVNPEEGSWFITQTIKVFEKHYKKEHVADMMTVVNLSVAELRGKIVHRDQPATLAIQMPCTLSTLRKRFFLYNRLQNSDTRLELPSLNIQRYGKYPSAETYHQNGPTVPVRPQQMQRTPINVNSNPCPPITPQYRNYQPNRQPHYQPSPPDSHSRNVNYRQDTYTEYRHHRQLAPGGQNH